MDELCKVFQCQTSTMSFFDEEGNESDRMTGYTIELFVPSDKRSDIDRNADMREELSEAIDAAITLVETP